MNINWILFGSIAVKAKLMRLLSSYELAFELLLLAICGIYVCVFGFKSILLVFWFVTGLVSSDCFLDGNHWFIMYLSLYLD